MATTAPALRRVTFPDALKVLAITRNTLNLWLQDDVFTVSRDRKGPKARKFLMSDELDCYLKFTAAGPDRAKEEVLALRRMKGRLRRRGG